MGANTTTKYKNSELKKQGIKHGVREVERSYIVDEDGEVVEDDVYWREDRRHFENDCLQKVANVLVWMRCLAADPDDMYSLKNWLCWMQWLALVCDFTSAIVAVVTFHDVTYCCGEPILNFAGDFPWKNIIRALTYSYIVMVFLEIYPVVRKGFPFNVVNPLVGFVITFAMFFDDSKVEALIMWAIETAAIICEFILYRLKVYQRRHNEKELVRVGRLTKKEPREVEEGENPDAPEKELKKIRQRYYQLKQDQLLDKSMLWYLRLACYINIFLSALVLAIIIFIARGGGLCIHNSQPPNPFNLDQIGECPLCQNATGTAVCEICSDDVKQCYYPYS